MVTLSPIDFYTVIRCFINQIQFKKLELDIENHFSVQGLNSPFNIEWTPATWFRVIDFRKLPIGKWR